VLGICAANNWAEAVKCWFGEPVILENRFKREGADPNFCRGYSLRDTGSDSFFGDFLGNKDTRSRPEAGRQPCLRAQSP
jgi:hypothetical protein